MISEDEVVDGTGLQLPAGDEILGPVALGIVGFGAVTVISRIGRRFDA